MKKQDIGAMHDRDLLRAIDKHTDPKSEHDEEDEDPTPYCTWCGAKSSKHCKCPPRAEND
jgi:hypothetical protein